MLYHHSWDYDFKEKPSLNDFREYMSWSINTVREREGWDRTIIDAHYSEI